MTDEQDKPTFREALVAFMLQLQTEWGSTADAALPGDEALRAASATDTLLELLNRHDPCRVALRQAVYMFEAMNNVMYSEITEDSDQHSKVVAALASKINNDWKEALQGTGAEVTVVCANCDARLGESDDVNEGACAEDRCGLHT